MRADPEHVSADSGELVLLSDISVELGGAEVLVFSKYGQKVPLYITFCGGND